MTHIGIDPGLSGGIAWIRDGRPCAEKMPATDRDMLDLLRQIIREESPGCVFCVLEKVHSMPSQGVTSTFTFGEHFGKLQMALSALEVPFQFVTPQRWQKALGCLTGGDKNVSKQAAQRAFPEISKITHATADALLLAAYCKQYANT